MAAKWEIDFSDLDKLESKMKKIPNESEKTINEVIHKRGIVRVESSIQPRIPVSTLKGAVRSKKHARDVKFPTTSQKLNLAFVIRPKPKYQYLKYPDLAIGQSKRNKPEEFMATGLEKAAPEIVEDISLALDDVIKRTLGGK